MKIIILFFISIYSFLLIANPNISINKNNKIMEIKKIDINGLGERKRINFYSNGEVEEIVIEEENKLKINRFKIRNERILSFLNNISLSAINSIKNDKIEYNQKYKNRKIKFDYNDKTISFDYYGDGKELFGKKEGNLRFNNKNRIINYKKVYFDNKWEVPENNLSIYEIKYKNKLFIITDYKEDYENKEIRLLIDLISYPFFLREDLDQKQLSIDEIQEKDLVSNIQIERIEFFDNFYYSYNLYQLDNENISKLSYIPTGYLNQIDLNEESFTINKKYLEELIKFINDLSKSEDGILEYSYKVKSLENLRGNFTHNLNNMKVLFNNKVIENPVIYRIYNKSLNPIIIVKERKDKNNLLDGIENNAENRKKIQNEKIVLTYKNSKIREKKFFYNKNFSFFVSEKDCCVPEKERDGVDMLFIHDVSIVNKDENEMREITKNLKNNWKFKGLDLDERKSYIDIDIYDAFEELKTLLKKNNNVK